MRCDKLFDILAADPATNHGCCLKAPALEPKIADRCSGGTERILEKSDSRGGRFGAHGTGYGGTQLSGGTGQRRIATAERVMNARSLRSTRPKESGLVLLQWRRRVTPRTRTHAREGAHRPRPQL